MTRDTRGEGARPYRWLALLPTLGLLGGVPFANRVRPFVLGLPFLLAWIVGWVIAVSVVMAIVFRLDHTGMGATGPASPSGSRRDEGRTTP